MKYNRDKTPKCKFNQQGMCMVHDHPILGTKICKRCKEPFKPSYKTQIYCEKECKVLARRIKVVYNKVIKR